jgi:hypothetical protein
MHGCLPSWMLYTHDEELLQRECPTIQDTHHKYITDHFDILPARDASKNDSIAYR